MDVICDHCRTEYEFDEALVSARGTTVKCTLCGHLFKVFRIERALPIVLPGTCWTVRRRDGSSQELSNLVDIMRLIGEGHFARDDEVSRTGKAWRRLGDVEELEPFFVDADRRGPSRAREDQLKDSGERVAVLARDATRLGKRDSDPDATRPVHTLKRSRIEAGGRDQDHAGSHGDNHDDNNDNNDNNDNDDDEAQTEEHVLPRPELASSPRVLPPINAAKRSSWPLDDKSERAARPRGARTREARAHAARPDEGRPSIHTPGPVSFPAPPSEAPPSASRLPLPAAKWVWSGACAVAIVSLGLFYVPPLAAPRAAVTQLPPEDPSSQYSARAEQLVASHRLDRFDEALTEHIKALAFHEHDPEVLCAIARVHAIWAEELLFEVEASEASGSARSECALRSGQARTHTEQAKRYAQTAARIESTRAETALCLSDALRLGGDLAGARAELERARSLGALGHRNAAEGLRIAALLAITEAQRDARAGRELAAQAVAKDPSLLRTRLLYARTLVAAGDLEGARRQLQEVRKRDADHPAIATLERVMSRPADAPRADALAAAKASASGTEASATGASDGLNHEGYITRGQAALESGQVNVAKRLFEQALFVRPNSTQAHAGLGYVALEKNRPALAIEHFSSATRAGNDEALIGLGEAYRRVGRSREALRAYQNYVNKKPNGNQISIARAQVERLGGDAGTQKTP